MHTREYKEVEGLPGVGISVTIERVPDPEPALPEGGAGFAHCQEGVDLSAWVEWAKKELGNLRSDVAELNYKVANRAAALVLAEEKSRNLNIEAHNAKTKLTEAELELKALRKYIAERKREEILEPGSTVAIDTNGVQDLDGTPYMTGRLLEVAIGQNRTVTYKVGWWTKKRSYLTGWFQQDQVRLIDEDPLPIRSAGGTTPQSDAGLSDAESIAVQALVLKQQQSKS